MSSRLRVQIASDIHLEKRDTPRVDIPALAPYLILAGDIGDPFQESLRALLSDLSGRFERVVYVPGNHEFRTQVGTGIRDFDDAVRQLTHVVPHGVDLLQRGYVDIDGTRVLGCTLWSELPPDIHEHVYTDGDFRTIAFDGALATPADLHRLHVHDREWLECELARAADESRDCIVVTHHAPLMSGTSDPQYECDPDHYANFMSASDLRSLMVPPVRAWVYGHTHWPGDTRAGGVPGGVPGGVRVLSNPWRRVNMDMMCTARTFEL